MELVSQCALRATNFVWRPGHGGFAFTVVCKATFDLRSGVSPLATQQEPVILADALGGEAGALTFASDLVPFKKRPEVLVTGHAHAPGGGSVPSLTARLVVGEIDKAIQVTGDRSFGADGTLGEPARFARMPLVWERAAGGPKTANPAGRPLGAAAKVDSFGRVSAPNLLPVGVVLASRSEVVAPVGFAPIAPLWPSRAVCLHRHGVGWDPARWHEQPLPADIDLAYFNAAPADQQGTAPFGEEQIHLENLHPRFARLTTRLAPVAPVATVDLGTGPQPLQLRCDTLIFNTDRGLAMLVWRAHVLLDHPERPGRVVVTEPAALPGPASVGPRSIRTLDAVSFPATLPPDVTNLPVAVLPFAGAAAPGQSAFPPPPSVGTSAPPPASIAAQPISIASRPIVGAINPGANPGSSRPMTVALFNQESDETLTPGFLVPVAALPFATSPNETLTAGFLVPAAALPFAAPVDEALAPALLYPAAAPPYVAPLPAAAPPYVAPLDETSDPPDAGRPPPPDPVSSTEAAPGEAPAVEPEPEADFQIYPPARCGEIAARLACGEGSADELLREKGLDAARWQQVHEHWLERIDDETARGRKKLLSEYDSAYVSALEALRGPIGVEDYARLAEAAERDEEVEGLAGRGLPEEAWPHLHRVWIQRMVRDMKLGKQVRAAIDALRNAAS